jgi:hypothetical protein
MNTTMNCLMTYRNSLIEQLTSHAIGTIEANLGGWATDRLNDIRETEWDLMEMGAEFEPFNLAHWRMANEAPTPAQEQSIKQLLEIRDSAHADLSAVSVARRTSTWARDRINDILYCNRQLQRLGYLPADVAL